MRLFVALALPDDLREALTRLQHGLPGVRWLAPESLHLTLRFLGDLDRGQAQDVDAALARVAPTVFEARVAGVGLFGSDRRPHSLWAGVERSAPLQNLHDKIDRAVTGAGLPADLRKFHPHITLARIKGEVRRDRLQDWLMANGAFLAPPLMVDRFVLMQSHRHRDGADYVELQDYPLAGAVLSHGIAGA